MVPLSGVRTATLLAGQGRWTHGRNMRLALGVRPGGVSADGDSLRRDDATFDGHDASAVDAIHPPRLTIEWPGLPLSGYAPAHQFKGV